MADKTSADEITELPLSFGVRETGETHGVQGGAVTDLVRDEQGNPTREYVLLAEIDGVKVPLATYNFGRLNTLAAALKARQSAQSDE